MQPAILFQPSAIILFRRCLFSLLTATVRRKRASGDGVKDEANCCDEAISESGAQPHRLPSGPLHDAAEVARSGVPTIMMFVQSLHGISHNKIEDTKEEHLELAVTAFDKLADKAMAWIAVNSDQ
jgi:acetylornithine deacetylase/succinyl-diaminopimelate desuccinylase-like protein